MRDRKGTNDLANGAVCYGAYDAAGNLLRQVWLRLEDEPLAEETLLVKANLLTDETAALLWTADDAPATRPSTTRWTSSPRRNTRSAIYSSPCGSWPPRGTPATARPSRRRTTRSFITSSAAMRCRTSAIPTTQ